MFLVDLLNGTPKTSKGQFSSNDHLYMLCRASPNAMCCRNVAKSFKINDYSLPSESVDDITFNSVINQSDSHWSYIQNILIEISKEKPPITFTQLLQLLFLARIDNFLLLAVDKQ